MFCLTTSAPAREAALTEHSAVSLRMSSVNSLVSWYSLPVRKVSFSSDTPMDCSVAWGMKRRPRVRHIPEQREREREREKERERKKDRKRVREMDGGDVERETVRRRASITRDTGGHSSPAPATSTCQALPAILVGTHLLHPVSACRYEHGGTCRVYNTSLFTCMASLLLGRHARVLHQASVL